ncbi:MAG: division/cell wall cluster transcriptional repressor MraZ [Kiritimatiellia bacterium]
MSEKVETVAVEESVARSGALVGRFDYALDPKKRFTIPSEWRTLMGNPRYVYVMPDPVERCLDLVPTAEMESRLAKLREKALFDPVANRALQTIGAVSELPTLDIQGRIRISDRLLQFANLTTTVAMLGSVRMVKLWDPQALAPAATVDQQALASALAEAGF